MCVVKTTCFRGFREVPAERRRGVDAVAGLRGRRYDRRLLTVCPDGERGGTVEPPRDFHTSYPNFPLYKRAPSVLDSRNARWRAPPLAHAGLFLACRWLVRDLNLIL